MKLLTAETESLLPYVDMYLETKVDKDETILIRKMAEMTSILTPDIPVGDVKRVTSAFMYLVNYVVMNKHYSVLLPNIAQLTPVTNGKHWRASIKPVFRFKKYQQGKVYKKTKWKEVSKLEHDAQVERYRIFREKHGLEDNKASFYFWMWTEREEKEKIK
jgi:hypothetical protein